MTKKEFRKWNRNHNNSDASDAKNSDKNSSVIYNNINLGNDHIYEVFHTIFQIALQEAKLVVLNKNDYIKLDGKKLYCYFNKNRSNCGYANWDIPYIEYVGRHCFFEHLDIDYRKHLLKKHGVKGFNQEMKTLPVVLKSLKKYHETDAWLSVNNISFFNTNMFGQLGSSICHFVQQSFGELIDERVARIYKNVAKDLIHIVRAYKKYGDRPISSNSITRFH